MSSSQQVIKLWVSDVRSDLMTFGLLDFLTTDY
jgi:hypothetical protein